MPDPTLAVGEMWDRRFAAHPWPTEPDALLVEMAAGLPAGRALDLGSGPGRNSLWLASRGWDVTAVDASQVALSQAMKRASYLGLTLRTVRADVTEWFPGRAAYDLVVVANLHPGMEALSAVLAGAAEALVPAGHLFVVGHDIVNLARHGPPDAARLLSVERLSSALPPGLSVDVLERRPRRSDDAPAGSLNEDDVAVLAWSTRLN